ncbi:hypothetical protein EK904_004392 [Melospiza melodia maxima]|nr:hypothetical protein EK904_004392 [Melospiza melodia maxima]
MSSAEEHLIVSLKEGGSSDALELLETTKLLKILVSEHFCQYGTILMLVGFVYACYVVSVFTEEEDSCLRK